jgi:hypothetical protein
LFPGVDKIVGYTLSHEVMNCTVPTPGKDAIVALSGERFLLKPCTLHTVVLKSSLGFVMFILLKLLYFSLQHGVDLLESMQNGHKKKNTKKSLKVSQAELGLDL